MRNNLKDCGELLVSPLVLLLQGRDLSQLVSLPLDLSLLSVDDLSVLGELILPAWSLFLQTLQLRREADRCVRHTHTHTHTLLFTHVHVHSHTHTHLGS